MNLTVIANIIGIAAVILCVLSYQCKTRRGILLVNVSSRIFYVLQYILLGAFEGAVLDFAALAVSVAARYKDSKILNKHFKRTVLIANLFVVAMGLTCYQNIFSLLPIVGVLFETGAFWLSKEPQIRIVSFLSVPFWLAYNLIFAAYGSAIGNVMTIVSIGTAIVRYDILKKKP